MSIKTPKEVMASSEGRIAFRDLTLMLHYRCNFRCRDCLIGEKLDSKQMLTFAQAKAIIDSAAELRTIRAIALAGGEPFLAYKLMLEITDYTWSTYRCGISVSTNCSWGKNRDVAIEKLRPLHECGMRWMLASWDVFHADFGKLDHVVSAIQAAQHFGIIVSLQNIRTKNSFKNESIKDAIKDRVDVDRIDWVENHVVPVGLGVKGVTHEEQNYLPQLPVGDCNAGTVLNIETDGEVKPCCGAAFMNRHLSLGNVFKDSLKDIVTRASIDGRTNALVAHQGPRLFLEVLNRVGRQDLIPKQFSSSCDACNQVLNNDEARRIIDDELSNVKLDLVLARMARQHACVLTHSDS